jgi:hypothetical protein
MSLSGQSASQEMKCAALGQFDMSRPTSLNSGNAFSSKPGILSDIDSEEFIGFGTQIELGMGMAVLLSLFAPGSISVFGRVAVVFPRGRCGLERLQHLFDFQIAVYDLLLIDAVQISRLTEGKQMLGPPVAFQRFSARCRL